jgi:hypothetical protein
MLAQSQSKSAAAQPPGNRNLTQANPGKLCVLNVADFHCFETNLIQVIHASNRI